MEVRFEQLESLHWLWVVAALAGVIVVGARLRQRALRRFATPGIAAGLAARVSPGRRFVRAALVLAALPCLVAAMIDPRWGVTYQPVQQRGIDLVVVLDLSKSMLAEDVEPNRVGRARQFIGDLVEQLGGDRIGLVTFAGTATIACPLTVDYGAFLLTLDVASVETMPRGGSLLGDAIRVAGTAFTDEVPDHKAIIIFTDGEDHGSYPRQAVESLRDELPVPIYTVGIGDADEGARIPVPIETGRSLRARTNLMHEGQEVWTKLDPVLLRTIALESGGAYVPVGTGTVDMGRVYQEKIEPVAKREYEATERKRHHARYQWFAGLALVLLLVESFIGDGRVRRSTTERAVADAVRNRPMRQRPKTRLATLALATMAFLPILLGAAPANAPAPSPPADAIDTSPRTLAREAGRAMQEQRYDDAIGFYDKLREAMPDAPEIPYNQGVAAYRAGALDRAAEFFRQTLDIAEDPMLRAQSAYNLGTTAHRRTLEQTQAPPADPSAPPADPMNPGAALSPPGTPPGPQAGNPIGEAMEELDRAIAHYRDALDADPSDMDARANAELAWNLRQQLEEMQQQQQQQQGDGEDQEQQDQDENQDQQQQQQQQGEDGEQSQDQQDQPDESQDQQQSQGQSQDESQEEEEEEQEQQQPQSGEEQEEEQQQPQTGEDEQQQQEQEQQQQAESDESQEQDEPRRMSREEAERLLQGVRDKERRRREELARREASKLPPVTKDW